MRMQADNVFVDELKKAGYDIDYKKLTEIYMASRQRPEVILRRQRNSAINSMIEARMQADGKQFF